MPVPELFAMWRNTRMVVLTAITAALYAAALLAFKFLSILPGVTEIRPGVAFVLLCSLLFGPAGAWGAAIGNTIGDFFGGLGVGTLVGFLGNLALGMVPYKLWRGLGLGEPDPERRFGVLKIAFVSVAASGACAFIVGAAIAYIGAPFRFLANTILITNSIVCVALGPFLLKAIYPRVKAQGLRYQDILGEPARPRGRGKRLAAALVALAVAGGIAAGNAAEAGLLPVGVAAAVLPAAILLVIALAWL